MSLQKSEFEDLSKWQMKSSHLNRIPANIKTQVRAAKVTAGRVKPDKARADNTPRILPVAPNRKISNASRPGASKNRADRVDNARVRVGQGSAGEDDETRQRKSA